MPGHFIPRLPPQRQLKSSQCSAGSSKSPPEPAFGKEKLDLTQRLEKKLAEYAASGSVVKRWLFEITSLLVSLGCFVGMIAMYIQAKDEPLLGREYIIAFANGLGKVASVALILPVTEALGQLKWNWFHKSNAMWDFEIFDKATRGPWGAFLLLYRTKGKSLAALGAILVLLLLANDSFLQRVIDLPSRFVMVDVCSQISTVTWYGLDFGKQFRDGSEIATGDPDMFLVVEKFSYGNGTTPGLYNGGTRANIPLSCPTSNCTWPEYETLAVCSQCSDVSSLLDYACIEHQVDWTSKLQGGFDVQKSSPTATMCGFYLNLTSSAPVLMSGYVNETSGMAQETLLTRTLPLTTMLTREPLYGNGSINFKHLRNTIMDVLIVAASDGTAESVQSATPPIAHECVPSWCVQTLHSSYSWGQYSENAVATVHNTTPGQFPWFSEYVSTSTENFTNIIYNQDINIELFPESSALNTPFGLSNSTASAILQGFTDIFPSFTTASENTALPPVLRYKTWDDGPAWNRFLDHNPWLHANVSKHMDRFARAMTDQIRSSNSKSMVAGISYDRETFISVRWEWLIFPLTLLVLTSAFLISTIMKTSMDTAGAGLWKTSAMPALIYGLPKETQDKLAPAAGGKGRGEAKKIQIKLSPRMGWRVSGQSFRQASPVLPVRNGQGSPEWI